MAVIIMYVTSNNKDLVLSLTFKKLPELSSLVLLDVAPKSLIFNKKEKKEKEKKKLCQKSSALAPWSCVKMLACLKRNKKTFTSKLNHFRMWKSTGTSSRNRKRKNHRPTARHRSHPLLVFVQLWQEVQPVKILIHMMS